jgi:predicted phage-related endonuclease
MNQKQLLSDRQKGTRERDLKRKPPEPRNLHVIQSLRPIPKATGCQVTKEIQQDVDLLALIIKARKKLVEREEITRGRITGYMKNHETLLDGETVLATWKGQKRSTLDMERLKADHPTLYGQYMKDQTFRVFRLKEF